MASATSTAVFAVVAKDAASGVMRGIGKQMGSLGKTGGAVFKSIAAGAAIAAAAITAAFAAAARFAKSAIDAAIADDAEQQKLIATLEARGVSTQKATERINELIAAGQKLAFTDSEVRSGINIVSQFTANYAKQTKILTVAQNVARAKNISLEQATKLVSKAYNGSGKALKQLGVDLERTVYWTETKEKKDRKGIVTEEKTVKSRKEIIKGMKAVNILGGEFAGVAEKYAQTFAGQFDKVRDSINETVEAIGYAIGGGEGLPTFTRLLEGITPVVDDLIGEINKNLPAIERFSRELVEKFLAKLPGYVAKAKRELPILIDKAKEFIGSVAGFGKDIASFLGPEGLVTAGIAALGGKMAGLGGALGATFASEFIKLGVDPITATITGTLAGAITAGIVQGFASTAAQAAVTKFLGLFKSISVTPSIPTALPGGATAAGGAASAVGTIAVSGLAAVAASAAAVASIVAIAAVAYSSIVPKNIQAAISARLGEFGKRAGQEGTATGSGGAYNAGGMYTGGTSSYLNLQTSTTLKLDGKVIAQSVDKHLGLTLKYGTSRVGGR